jgi:hypothetical protein
MTLFFLAIFGAVVAALAVCFKYEDKDKGL